MCCPPFLSQLFGTLQVTSSCPHFTALSLKLAGSHGQFCFSSSKNCFNLDKTLLALQQGTQKPLPDFYFSSYLCLSTVPLLHLISVQPGVVWMIRLLFVLRVSCVDVNLCMSAFKKKRILSKMHTDLCQERAYIYITNLAGFLLSKSEFSSLTEWSSLLGVFSACI